MATMYDIRKLDPRAVTDPRSGEVSTIWGGYPTARNRERRHPCR
jgi:hypothetical protein